MKWNKRKCKRKWIKYCVIRASIESFIKIILFNLPFFRDQNCKNFQKILTSDKGWLEIRAKVRETGTYGWFTGTYDVALSSTCDNKIGQKKTHNRLILELQIYSSCYNCA